MGWCNIVSMNSTTMTGNARTGEKLALALEKGDVIVTANQRLARWYQQCFAVSMLERGSIAWESPRIVSFDVWLKERFDDLFVAGAVNRFPLSVESELLLWEQVIDTALTDDIDAGLITGGATAKTVAAAWRIAHDYCWYVSLKTNPSLSGVSLTVDHQRYGSWAQLFEEACQRLGVFSAATLTKLVTDHLSSPAMTLPQSVSMAGFLSLNPAQTQLLDALVSLGVSVNKSADFTPEQTTVCEKVAYREAHEELYSVAAEVRHALEHSSDAASPGAVSLGVVIPDLGNRRAEVLRAFDAVFFPAASLTAIEQMGRPFDLSLGEPLRYVPAVDTALLLLRFAFQGLTDSDDISQLLSSCYLAEAGSERDTRSAFDIKRRSKAITALTVETLLEMERVPAGLTRIARQLQNRTPIKPALPSEWFRRFVNVLDAAGWPGESPPGSVEFQAIALFRDMLEGLGQLDLLTGEVSVNTMLQRVNDMSVAKVFQREVGATPIQIMGGLESQGLTFDRLWVVGLDIDTWPGRSRANPFLPLSWQREQQVPGASVQTDVNNAEVLTQWWKRCAEQVTFTWPQIRDAIEVDASPLIADVPVRDVSHPLYSEVTQATVTPVAQHIFAAVSLETLDDHQGPGVAVGDTVRGGARLFEDQASCPFRSFVTHRLRTRAVEDPVMGIDARDRGNVFHLAMQYFWETVKTHESLESHTADALKAVVNDCVDQAMEAVNHQSVTLRQLEAERNKTLMLEWITRHEWLREPFEVVATEREQTVTVNDITVTLKVDRVDALVSDDSGSNTDTVGGHLIIDYKTGKHNSTKSWNEPRIVSAQLPLYAAFNQEVTGVCFAQVARNRQGFIGLAESHNRLPGVKAPPDEQTWSEQVDRWKERLNLLAGEIKEGVASVTPVPGACTYCDLKSVCRIDAAALAVDEDIESEPEATR